MRLRICAAGWRVISALRLEARGEACRRRLLISCLFAREPRLSQSVQGSAAAAVGLALRSVGRYRSIESVWLL